MLIFLFFKKQNIVKDTNISVINIAIAAPSAEYKQTKGYIMHRFKTPLTVNILLNCFLYP